MAELIEVKAPDEFAEGILGNFTASVFGIHKDDIGILHIFVAPQAFRKDFFLGATCPVLTESVDETPGLSIPEGSEAYSSEFSACNGKNETTNAKSKVKTLLQEEIFPKNEDNVVFIISGFISSFSRKFKKI